MKQILTTLLLAVMALLPESTAAQSLTGEWQLHASFAGSNIQDIVDTPTKVYFLVSNGLFRYDKSSGEVAQMSRQNGLHDITPVLLSYDNASDVMAIAYDNCNIDLVRTDGSIVNFPDIKDLVYTSSATKKVNDINFADGNIYIATSFGYVVVDEATLSKVKSHIIYSNISSVNVVGSRIVMSVSTTLYYGDATRDIDRLGQMSNVTGSVAGKILPAGDNDFIVVGTAKALHGAFADGTPSLTEMVTGMTIDNGRASHDGFLINCKANKCYYTLAADGTTPVKVSSTGQLFSQAVHGDGTIWTLSANGIAPKGSTAYIMPNALGISNRAWWMAFSPNEDKLYVSRTTDNAILSVDYDGAIEIYNFDGTTWANATPRKSNGTTVARSDGNGGTYDMLFVPSQPSSYFIGTRGGAGTHHVVDGVVTQTFSNTTTGGTAFIRRGAMALDSQGNFFAALCSASDPNSVAAISAENLAKDVIPVSDLVLSAKPEIAGGAFKRMSMAIGKNDTKVASSCVFNEPVFFWDSNADLTTNRYTSYSTFVDQDNITFAWTFPYDLSSDLDGNVWFGVAEGVIYFDPSTAFDSDFHVNRLKQYDSNGNTVGNLLAGVQVNCVTVDGDGNHWIGTSTQGVTVVSRDCKRVLAQFSPTNSMLPSTTIYRMCYHPTRNSMFVMTNAGLAEFHIGASAASDNYDNTYVTPDPVRPDFTGFIEIKKLMRDSRLTIVNAAGQTVATLTADGGTALWDGCDSQGNRLPTGVYTVLASPDDSTEPVAVAKVRLIK